MLELSGIPILTDFGQMRPLEPGNRDWWMPGLYRASEVLLNLPWGFPVDIWSIGVMTLELLEDKNLFGPIDQTNNQYVLLLAMAQYIGYLGLPPLEMIKQSPLSMYFDGQGNRVSNSPIPQTSFEDFVIPIPPGEEKDMFPRLELRRMK
ncbi:uncharacterized protein ASPGLDRAFT_55214 [Aspergillus glaucus CBS 516.65]|uniref:Protein kinase domain-containing protein n=1 Tax=Aspergillus glaucus CBS 516.65 TaxID=1160497 RepID=A0A1L9VVK9_ASPGL|nr:hypothetical protein ASPGLDRAFT_55214 [Aspergillus glaucus CBS 516.65]OJJ87940.1 hypothetical protein ASPGLDRAFT_55214 [Aspergillus glaucus CBS 516.65]